MFFSFILPLVLMNSDALKLRVSNAMNRANGINVLPQLVKPLKLPVWPVWSGVLAQLADFIKLTPVSEAMINNIGGRVVPMQLTEMNVSPFLLLVHHSHSFTPFDPFRFITNLVLPEGFPAHPHFGFDTVTYCMEGGMRHRDSEGEAMNYGNGEVQWMRAGRGVIHEEMWDVDPTRHTRVEIFQLWVNLPKSRKQDPPSVVKLRNSDLPVIPIEKGSIKLLCGDVEIMGNLPENVPQVTSAATNIIGSPVSLLHLRKDPYSVFSCDVSSCSRASFVVYVRRGSVLLESGESARQGSLLVFDRPQASSPEDLFPRASQEAQYHITAGSDGLDALVMVGEPLNEPVIWQGPFVQADQREFERGAAAFQRLGLGAFWDFKLTTREWIEHIKKLDLQRVLTGEV